MTTNTDHDENADGSNSTTNAAPANYLQSVLGRLTGEPPRIQQRVDETGRFWLEDRENREEAYVWSRQTIDVEAVR